MRKRVVIEGESGQAATGAVPASVSDNVWAPHTLQREVVVCQGDVMSGEIRGEGDRVCLTNAPVILW